MAIRTVGGGVAYLDEGGAVIWPGSATTIGYTNTSATGPRFWRLPDASFVPGNVAIFTLNANYEIGVASENLQLMRTLNISFFNIFLSPPFEVFAIDLWTTWDYTPLLLQPNLVGKLTVTCTSTRVTPGPTYIDPVTQLETFWSKQYAWVWVMSLSPAAGTVTSAGVSTYYC